MDSRHSVSFDLRLLLTTVFAVLATHTIEAAASEPITVVVLPPPQLLEPNDSAAADLFCGRLEAELAKDPGLRVVDRSQIDRVLAERATGAVKKPALAYDAMVRVSIDRLQAKPAVVLSVVDLSNGNLAGSRQWPWAPEMPDAVLREMAGACKQLAIDAVAASRGRLKVRFLGVSTPDGMSRLEPMRAHLQEILERVAAEAPNVCVVHHLEAITAAEESLLLLLGHVRLAGGRQFTPQADRLLNAELVEVESEGRTFEDTTIELRFRLCETGGEGEWTTMRGKVADWPALAPKLCELLAGQLGQARPAEAADMVAEMITRRNQAKAELEAAAQYRDKDGKPDRERIAAAAKLDPSYEPAAYAIVRLQRTHKERLREALAYLERFEENVEHRKYVFQNVYHDVRAASHRAVESEQADRVQRRQGVTMMNWLPRPMDPEETDMLRRLVEIGMSGHIEAYEPYCGWLVTNVYHGMTDCGIDPVYRWQWLDQIRRRVDVLLSQVGKVDHFHRGNVESSLLRVRSLLVTFAVEEGDAARVRDRLAEFTRCGRSVARDSWQIGKHLRDVLAGCGDERLLEDYDRWLARWTTPVRQIELVWNDFPVYEEAVIEPQAERSLGMVPLAICRDILYGVAGTNLSEIAGWADRLPSRQYLCRTPVDAEGRPARRVLPDMALWRRDDIAVTGAACFHDNLCVGTKRTGLLVLDPATGLWQAFGPAEGLPDPHVYFVGPLDEHRLLVVTGQKERTVYCTLELHTGRISLLHRLDGKSPLFRAPAHLWRDGEKLMAMGYVGLAQDVLRVAPEFRAWPNVWPYGWQCRPRTYSPKPTSMAVVDGRRYVMAYTGLHEVNDSGDVRRSWFSRVHFYAGRRDHDNLARDSILTPSSLPDDHPRTCYQFVAQGGSHFFLVGGRDSAADLLCYEPATDTWFGPLRLANFGADPYPLGTASGVWVGGPDGLAYIGTSSFLDAARAAGRVMTTAAVAERKRELAEAAGPLEAAKFRLLLRDFDGARQRTQTILAANPDDPQALLLMAVLHDFWCLDRPDESLRWYRRLSAMEADPSAIYTGLYGQFRIHYTLKQWDHAITAGERLLEEVPHLYGGMTSEVERFLEYARKHQQEDAQQITKP
ncbi:MAG: hypothetical protein RBS80_00640 [Thermoguttaceae bacterium]|nr:hypothetical protein [Thermoguttaceae bacterium]